MRQRHSRRVGWREPRSDGTIVPMADLKPDDDAHDPIDPADFYSGPDWLLRQLVEMVNQSDGPDNRTSVTLVVNGSVVTGQIVPAWRWFELQAERVRGASPDSNMGEFFEALVPHMKQAAGSEEWPSYVNLADAHYLMADDLLRRDEGFLWRGRLVHVSGWSLGSFSST